MGDLSQTGREKLAKGTLVPGTRWRTTPYRRLDERRSARQPSSLLEEQRPVNELDHVYSMRSLTSFRWRAEQFREPGFNDPEACELAASEADLGQARYLLGSGCRPRTWRSSSVVVPTGYPAAHSASRTRARRLSASVSS